MMDYKQIDIYSLPYVLLSEKTKLPEIAAVYFCLDEYRQIQYIGQSKNLNRRWIQHQKYEELMNLQNIKIAYMPLKNSSLLVEAEKILIDKFNPPLNLGVHPNSLANLRPNYKGAKPKYGTPKKNRVITVTTEGWEEARAIAKEEYNLTISQVVELIGRRKLILIEAEESEK